MKQSRFNPGFRISIFDVVILAAGTLGAIYASQTAWWAGAIVAIVVLHFFLFCNVFRISRPPELIWGAGFLLLAAPTILVETPGWVITFLGSIALSSFLIYRETKKESYHGILWERWNPNLEIWWESKNKWTR